MWTVADLAQHIGGKVVGNGAHVITGVADLRGAQPHHLSFLANPKYNHVLLQSRAGAVLVRKAIPQANTNQIVTADPYLGLAKLATLLHPPPAWSPGVDPKSCVAPLAEVHPTARIDAGAVVEDGAIIGAGTRIGAGCYVGAGARIGAKCVLHPGAKVMAECLLGDRVILQPGAIIGSDGFGYAVDDQAKRHKIPQLGHVKVGNDVEIGANCTVDRATFGATVIGEGCKIDNLVQIGHNVVLGQDCVIVSQSGIAGSTRLGDRVIVGAQGGLIGHITVASDVVLGGRAGVIQSVEQAGTYSGFPLLPHRMWLKTAAMQQHLPELRQKIRDLEAKVATLEQAGKAPFGNAHSF